MREEKIFDVNWEGERNISENPQAFKMYSYPPGTIRNMSVPGFIIWLVLLLGSIGGFVYGAWMWITGDYENETVVRRCHLYALSYFWLLQFIKARISRSSSHIRMCCM